MSDLQVQLEKAIDQAAQYELLGSLAADQGKREEYRTLARFHQSIADELRREIDRPQDLAQRLADSR